MFGFGAISELPISALPVTGTTTTHTGSATLSASASTTAYPQPLPGAATLSATGSTLSVGTRHICSASLLADTGTLSAVAYFTWTNSKTLSSSASISAYPQPLPGLATLNSPVTVSADGELTKLGASSLSASGTVAAAGELNKLGATSLSSSATIAAYPQPLSITATLSGSTTVSAAGGLTKFGTAALSVSASVLNEFELNISAASLLADIGALSGKMVGSLNRNAGGLSSSATVSSNGTRTIHGSISVDSSASVSSAGTLEKNGQAHVSTLGSFTSGFTQGFDRGSFVSGHPFMSQNHLSVNAALVANGTRVVFGSVSMPAVATVTAPPTFHHGVFSTLQSIGSLSGNSVLLHGGSVDLKPLARLQARPSGDYARPDIIQMALYIDKFRGITANIDKTRSITGYIDKQISVDSKIDLSSGVTSYIDKIVEKTLVRER